MKGILADRNNEGHVALLVRKLEGEVWCELWKSLHLRLFQFQDLGLDHSASDLHIWQVCQSREIALITINRNAREPDSLEDTLRRFNTATCLPVFTLANPDRLPHDNEYAERVAERLLEFLLEIDRVLGVGRIFLP
jgi:hypothetical protein